MDIKKTLIVCLSFLFFMLFFGQGLDTQKKFALPENITFEDFIVVTKNQEHFNSFYHSSYLYFDLYIDTDEKDLYEMGYSLRFRKRIFNDSITNYTFQLKDEMTLVKEIRMEIEEKELDFYNIKQNNKWIPLTHALDTIFDLYSKLSNKKDSISFHKNLSLIKEWIKVKSSGSIAPFQRLRHIDSLTFNDNKIKSFVPVLIGNSIRKRAHIYVDSTYTVNEKLKFNRRIKANTPLFFQENLNFNWLFESSLDYSTFVYLKNNETIIIKEYEVENKFIALEKGRDLLKKYEKIMTGNLGMYIKYDSKYKQSIQYFNSN